ncbi:MAG: hypothetical protein PHX18_07610 [Candidatus Gastranaerophilales bacterium]|nr:hypothetical protein [Candidatus Gastranaerophilales bacterium]
MEINATIIASTISFLIFIFIMNSIMYKPIAKIIDERESYIENNKTEAQNHLQKATTLIENKNRKVHDTKIQSRDMFTAKTEEIKANKSKQLSQVKTDLNSDFEAKKQELENQKNVAIGGLRTHVADLANQITAKILGEGVTYTPLNEKEIDEVMNV